MIARDLDGSFCLVDTDTWNVAVLNETASDVWRLVDAGCSPEEIVRTLAEAYHTDADTISGDVLAALDELTAGGFVVVAPRG